MAATIKRIDRYRIIRLIGSGGMGEVYQAQDPNVDRLVAIKLLKESLNTDEFRERFLGEARAAAKLEHPNVVKIFDAAKFRGRPFIAMEYISGSSLAQVIARADPVLGLQRKLEILEQLCAGLAGAHAVGIIHRDVKPGNVMLDDSGRVKIVDFGIAKSNTWEATSEQISMGTPCYMSPEQLRQRSVDHRTDMFSAAVVAYELLTYRKLFEGDAVQQVARVLSGHVPPMGAVTSAIPGALDRVILRALATQPADRFRDMAEMQRALAAVREQLPGRALPSLNGNVWNRSDTLIDGSFPDVEPVPTRPGTWLPRAGACVAVAAFALGVWLLFTRPVSDGVTPAVIHGGPRETPTVRPDTPVGPRPESTHLPEPSKKAEAHESNVPPTTRTADGAATNPGSGAVTPLGGDVGNSGEAAPPPEPVPEPKPMSPEVKEPLPEPAPVISITRRLSADDEAGVQLALKKYEDAYEKLSSVPVKAIWPTLTHDETTALDSKFLDAQSYRVEMSKTQIASIDPTRAKVSCILTERITLKRGDARIVTSVATIILKKSDDGWFIDEISSRALKR